MTDLQTQIHNKLRDIFPDYYITSTSLKDENNTWQLHQLLMAIALQKEPFKIEGCIYHREKGIFITGITTNKEDIPFNLTKSVLDQSEDTLKKINDILQ